MPFADEFRMIVDEQPPDWAFFECHLTVDDPHRLADVRVALARANARPVRTLQDHDFEITVANTHGRGAAAGVVESALRIIDGLGVRGRIWCGETDDSLLPAPAHRFGP